MKKPEVFDVRISYDQYKAFLTIDPDAVLIKVTVETLREALKAKGVVFGLKEEVLVKIAEVHKTRKVAANILVAEGIPPFLGEKASVSYKFKLSSQPGENLRGKLDYRDISSIIQVKKRQILAIKRPLKPPTNGITVRGQEIIIQPLTDISLEAGENVVKVEKDGLWYFVSAVNGALRFERNTLSVSTSIKIPGDVDFNVGNIRFDGDVIVGGDVKPDFIVEAGGNVKIGDSALACNIRAGKDVFVEGGIIGKNRGSVVSKGNITASYVEKTTLNAEGNITIKNGITGSALSGDGSIYVENEEARTVSSTLKAARHISIGAAGSRVDQNTWLMAGFEPLYEKEYSRVKEATELKILEKKNIEKRYGQETLETKKFPENAPDKMKLEIEKWDILRMEIDEAKELLTKWEPLVYHTDASITIRGILFPGVRLQIGQYAVTSNREYRNITIRYPGQGETLEIQRH